MTVDRHSQWHSPAISKVSIRFDRSWREDAPTAGQVGLDFNFSI
jgi:hypothetical protein